MQGVPSAEFEKKRQAILQSPIPRTESIFGTTELCTGDEC